MKPYSRHECSTNINSVTHILQTNTSESAKYTPLPSVRGFTVGQIQQRLASCGEGVDNVKRGVGKRWKAAGEQEKQGRKEREQGEADARAKDAAAAVEE